MDANAERAAPAAGRVFFREEPASAVEAIEKVLRAAASVGASDVHLDPRPAGVFVRFRVDGELEPADVLPARLHEEAIARLKIMSGARTDIHAVPQDGRWLADIAGEAYNARICFMPTYRGENAVIRLLPVKAAIQDSFASLGFTPDHAAAIHRAMNASSGLILVTGPTGSGKTTTLRVCLGLKAGQALSVMTLEDPVEYEVPGVRHVHIKRTQGVTFAEGLRSALRQDPDVIMVGEIRDGDTGRTAVHTALTGHLVLSTLHTVSALESILRLSDMGVERYLIAATLRAVVGQRLVRRICRYCGGAKPESACLACRGAGYAGRSVIAEVCEVDAGLKGLIAAGAPVAALRKRAVSRGFRPMSYDADEKVEWGVTSRAEVMKAMYD